MVQVQGGVAQTIVPYEYVNVSILRPRGSKWRASAAGICGSKSSDSTAMAHIVHVSRRDAGRVTTSGRAVRHILWGNLRAVLGEDARPVIVVDGVIASATTYDVDVCRARDAKAKPVQRRAKPRGRGAAAVPPSPSTSATARALILLWSGGFTTLKRSPVVMSTVKTPVPSFLKIQPALPADGDEPEM